MSTEKTVYTSINLFASDDERGWIRKDRIKWPINAMEGNVALLGHRIQKKGEEVQWDIQRVIHEQKYYSCLL